MLKSLLLSTKVTLILKKGVPDFLNLILVLEDKLLGITASKNVHH